MGFMPGLPTACSRKGCWPDVDSATRPSNCCYAPAVLKSARLPRILRDLKGSHLNALPPPRGKPDTVQLKRLLPFGHGSTTVMWIEPVVFGNQGYATAVVTTDCLYILPLYGDTSVTDLAGRGFWSTSPSDRIVRTVRLKDVTAIQRDVKHAKCFSSPEINGSSVHIGVMTCDEEQCPIDIFTFEPHTELEFHLRGAWLNTLFRRKAELPTAFRHTCFINAERYYSALEVTVVAATDVGEQTELLEELAHEMLHDISLKRLFFRSTSFPTQVLRWIDTFRADIARTEREAIEEAATANKSVSALDLQERCWPYLRRLLACVRLLFSALFESETLLERYKLFLPYAAPEYSLGDITRVLSEDLSDSLKVFLEDGGPMNGCEGRRADRSKFVRDGEATQSQLSFLRTQGAGRDEAVDVFATVHDTQVAILVLLDRTVAQYNLQKGEVYFPGVGSHICRQTNDLVGFVKNVVSRIVTCLEDVQEDERPRQKTLRRRRSSLRDTEGCLQDTMAVLADGLHALPGGRRDEVTGGGGDEDGVESGFGGGQKGAVAAEGVQRGVTGAGDLVDASVGREVGNANQADAVTDAPKDQEEQAEQAGPAAPVAPRRLLRRSSSSLHTTTPRGNGNFMRTLRALRKSPPPADVGVSDESTTSKPRAKKKEGLTCSDPDTLPMTRDGAVLEERLERLKPLVLLTRRDLSLYCHCYLLYLTLFDDYRVREACRDACSEEIRHFLVPLLGLLDDCFQDDPLRELCRSHLIASLDVLEVELPAGVKASRGRRA